MENEITNCIIILLLDYSDFSCQFCLESFLELCDTLKSRNLENTIILGILKYNFNKINKENRNKYTKLLKKQLKGFVKGNRINFPFILDYSYIFKNNKTGSSVIIINQIKGCIKQWQIPFTKKDL